MQFTRRRKADEKNDFFLRKLKEFFQLKFNNFSEGLFSLKLVKKWRIYSQKKYFL